MFSKVFTISFYLLRFFYLNFPIHPLSVSVFFSFLVFVKRCETYIFSINFKHHAKFLYQTKFLLLFFCKKLLEIPVKKYFPVLTHTEPKKLKKPNLKQKGDEKAENLYKNLNKRRTRPLQNLKIQIKKTTSM